jgi:formate-dependent nitrite reductase membrane component NrfD
LFDPEQKENQQATRPAMKEYEWMAEFTPQKSWIDGKGIFILLAEICGSLGGGLYVISAYLNHTGGMLVGFLILSGLKGVFHIAHLGKPLRFWRLALRPGSSWLARGFIFLVLFTVFAIVQLTLSYGPPGTGLELTFRVIAGVMAVLVATYSGFLMNYVNGIPFWNSALLPVLFGVYGLLGGTALLMGIGLLWGGADRAVELDLIRWLLVIDAFVVITYLLSASYMGPGGKESVRELIQGGLAPVFWVGVVLCGILVPGISLYLGGELSVPWLAADVILILVGVCGLNYCILKGGLYNPLVPVS